MLATKMKVRILCERKEEELDRGRSFELAAHGSKRFNFVVYGQTESLGFGPVDKTTLAQVFGKVEEKGAIVNSVIIPGKGIGTGFIGFLWGTEFYFDEEVAENVLLVIVPRSMMHLRVGSIPLDLRKEV